MDQIESALSPCDDGMAVYNDFFDDSYTQHRTVSTPPTTHHSQNIVDDLVQQIDMDNEYLSFVSKDNTKDMQYSSAIKHNSQSPPVTYSVPPREHIVPEDILQSAMSLQNIVKDNCDSANKVPVSVSQNRVNESNVSEDNDDYMKHFDELQKYSDLIQLPDMTSRFSTHASSQKEPMKYQQSQQQNIVQMHNFYEENSNGMYD